MFSVHLSEGRAFQHGRRQNESLSPFKRCQPSTEGVLNMAEGRSGARPTPRTARERTREPGDEEILDEAPDSNGEEREEAPAEEAAGYDDATHDRYEEIKRGELHLSELQRMTMPQLLNTAKREGVTEYSGLKKQDLIFKIL